MKINPGYAHPNVHIRVMPAGSRTKTLDINQLAKLIVDTSTGEAPESREPAERKKNPAAVALGFLGGKKGGKVRAEKLSKEQRQGITHKAAKIRWRKDGE